MASHPRGISHSSYGRRRRAVEQRPDWKPQWKPLSDEWFLSIVQQGGRTEELIRRLVRVGWFGPEFHARAVKRGRAHEVRRRIKKFQIPPDLVVKFQPIDIIDVLL
jgi:hypothetical protein